LIKETDYLKDLHQKKRKI